MSEGLKRTLYEHFLHFTHLNEQMFTAEISEFTGLAQLHGMTSIPSNLTSVHVIDCIGKHEPINNTSIAEKMDLSKASISKICNKLLEEGFVKRSQMMDNKKEIYFTLSPKGKKIFELHVAMHAMIEERFIASLNALSESEIQATLKFFQVMIENRDVMVRGEP